jgi:hypothetical protein
MISKELLSEVLENKVYLIRERRPIDISSNIIQYELENGFRPFEYINIYELAHKCKEWAISKGYCINLISRTNGLSTLIFLYGKDFDKKKEIDIKSSLDIKTENEAMFLMCEWILRETK